MCGIMGCIGENSVADVLDGLKLLEYRGYDSSGIAFLKNNKIILHKKTGNVSSLIDSLPNFTKSIHTCIGHTRWATHGKPVDKNAHPFFSNDKKIAIVHNGIIENYSELKNFLIDKNYSFVSETDSEVIANLLQYNRTDNPNTLSSVYKTVHMLKGSFSFVVISSYEQNILYFAKKDSPLVCGISEQKAYVCSDITGISEYLTKFCIIDDERLGYITQDEIKLFDFDNKLTYNNYVLFNEKPQLSLGNYDFFMKKEIDEIPQALSKTLKTNETINFGENIKKFKRIIFIGCGTALHAGMVAKQILKNIMPTFDCYAETSGEVIFNDYSYSDTLFVAVSQSGETADTLKAVRHIKSNNGKIIAICNVPSSGLVREADIVLHTDAGVEIAVASTKAYNCQLAILTDFCLKFADNYLSNDKHLLYHNILDDLKRVPLYAEKILKSEKTISEFAKKCEKIKSIFCLGRGLDYCVACEASLKIKEISYINSETYYASELKHGTLALIEKGVLILAIITQLKTSDKMLNCLEEVKSRGAKIFVVTKFNSEKIKKISDFVFVIPDTEEIVSPILSVIPTQLFAYYLALYKGLNVDKPRNLAKSVTVE